MNRCRNACQCMYTQCTNMGTNQNLRNSINNDENSCSCGFRDPMVFPSSYMYGQSYVPIQFINQTFKPVNGLKCGTIFPELVSPYEPLQSLAENAYLKEATENEGRCPNAI